MAQYALRENGTVRKAPKLLSYRSLAGDINLVFAGLSPGLRRNAFGRLVGNGTALILQAKPVWGSAVGEGTRPLRVNPGRNYALRSVAE